MECFYEENWNILYKEMEVSNEQMKTCFYGDLWKCVDIYPGYI